MDFFTALHISGSGLSAERTRVNIASSNLANAETTRTAEGGPTSGWTRCSRRCPATASPDGPQAVTVAEVAADPDPGQEAVQPRATPTPTPKASSPCPTSTRCTRWSTCCRPRAATRRTATAVETLKQMAARGSGNPALIPRRREPCPVRFEFNLDRPTQRRPMRGREAPGANFGREPARRFSRSWAAPSSVDSCSRGGPAGQRHRQRRRQPARGGPGVREGGRGHAPGHQGPQQAGRGLQRDHADERLRPMEPLLKQLRELPERFGALPPPMRVTRAGWDRRAGGAGRRWPSTSCWATAALTSTPSPT